jgi:hypothetical protein
VFPQPGTTQGWLQIEGVVIGVLYAFKCQKRIGDDVGTRFYKIKKKGIILG